METTLGSAISNRVR